MKRYLKILFTVIFMFLFLGSAFIIPVYYIYQSGKNFIEEIQFHTKSRAIEIATALDTMSGESLYYDNLISLSNVLAKIIEVKNQKEDPYKILEIFLLDNNHQLLAHNNIFKVAKDHQNKNDPKTQKLGRVLFANNNIDIEITGYSDVKLPEEVLKLDSFIPFLDLEEIVKNKIKKNIPELLANEFHVYSSVYPPDEILPRASLHIMIKNFGIEPLISYWIKQMFYVIIFSFIIFLILFGFFIITLYNLLTQDINKIVEKDLELLPEQIQNDYKNDLPEDELSLSNLDSKEFENDVIEEMESKTNVEKHSLNIQHEDINQTKNKVIFLKDFQKKKIKEENNKSEDIHQVENSSKKSLEKEKNTKKELIDYENIIDALPLD